MKEYLVKNMHGEYKVTDHHSGFNVDDLIEIPDGACIARFYPKDPVGLEFENSNRQWWDDEKLEWVDYSSTEYFNSNKFSRIVWQRSETEYLMQGKNGERLMESVGQLKGVEATLAQRQSEYGSFEDVAFVTENIMSILEKVRVNGLQDLPDTHRMALYMIASKMARIVNGDFNKLDSWHDIGGYAKLIENLIEGK